MTEVEDEGVAHLLTSNWLIEDIALVLEQINIQIKGVEEQARNQGLEPWQLMTRDGDYVLTSLLSGKAHALNAIAVLKSMEQHAQNITMNYYSSGEPMSVEQMAEHISRYASG